MPDFYLTKAGDASCLALYERTIPPIFTKTDEQGDYSVDPVKKSCCVHEQLTLCLSGGNSLTPLDKRELMRLFSATKAPSAPLTLSDRQTPSLFTSGLICGITPMSTRKRLGAEIPDFAFSLPDGRSVVEQREGWSFWERL
jgi:hypothetical protein